MKNFAKIIIAILLIFQSCNNPENIDKDSAIRINTDIYNDSFYLSDILTKPQIVPLETTKNCLISKISDIKFDEDKIFIFDNHSETIFIFSNTGIFQNKINYIGKGPGEYISIESFDIDKEKDRIILYTNPGKLLFYDYSGKFLLKVKVSYKLGGLEYSYFNNKHYFTLCSTGNSPQSHPDYNLISTDNKLNILDKYFKFPDFNNGYYNCEHVSKKVLQKKFNELIVTLPFSDAVYSISKNGNVSKRISLESKNKLTPQDLEEIQKNNVAIIGELRKLGKPYRISSFSENENIIYFKYYSNTEYHVFYSKKSKKQYNVSFKNLFDDVTFCSPKLMDILNSDFIGYIDQSKLKKLTGEKNSQNLPKELVEICSNANNSNPVLLYYKIKDSF